jgi:hypothetical protein
MVEAAYNMQQDHLRPKMVREPGDLMRKVPGIREGLGVEDRNQYSVDAEHKSA